MVPLVAPLANVGEERVRGAGLNHVTMRQSVAIHRTTLGVTIEVGPEPTWIASACFLFLWSLPIGFVGVRAGARLLHESLPVQLVAAGWLAATCGWVALVTRTRTRRTCVLSETGACEISWRVFGLHGRRVFPRHDVHRAHVQIDHVRGRGGTRGTLTLVIIETSNGDVPLARGTSVPDAVRIGEAFECWLKPAAPPDSSR